MKANYLVLFQLENKKVCPAFVEGKTIIEVAINTEFERLRLAIKENITINKIKLVQITLYN